MLGKVRMTFIEKFTRYWLPVIFWMAIIFWMSTETFSAQNTSFLMKRILPFLFPGISSQELPLIHVLIRKAGHITEYFILGILFFRALCGQRTALWNWRWSFFALVGVVLWAAMDEFHQSFVPTRTGSLADVGIDTAGGTLAQLVIILWLLYRRNRGTIIPAHFDPF